MLFQLSEIQKTQALIQNLEESKQHTYDTLVRSYSSNQGNRASIKQKCSTIIQQSALLIHILREIDQGVRYKSLLPAIFYEKDLNRLLYSKLALPDWFEHVFQKEYEKQKINLETVANKIYKLHGLSEKNAQLVKEHWNMEILLKRYESLNEKQLQSVDIIQEIEAFQNLYKSCKQIYKNFLDMMTKKTLEFLENTVESTIIYSSQLKKVKSFDQSRINQRDILVNAHQVNSPRNRHIQTSNFDSRNTIKLGLSDLTKAQTISLQTPSYNQQPNISSNNLTIHKNPTVESLKHRQKANNEFFFKQATCSRQKSNKKFIDTSLTKEITSARSDYNSDSNRLYYERSSQKYLKAREESKDSSVRSARSYYDESINLKKYGSSANNRQVPNHNSSSYVRKYGIAEESRQSPSIKGNNKEKINKMSSTKSLECYHHCPHHDKPLNNHCSKHCDKLCTHQKQYFNDFGLDLPEMNRQYFQNKEKQMIQALKSARSTGYSPHERNHTSRLRENGIIHVNRSRERNIAENKSFLRNSHDKHLDYYQSRMSPVSKENTRFLSNTPLHSMKNYGPSFHRTQRPGTIHKVQYPSSPMNNTRQVPSYRVSEYYFN